MKRIKEMAWIRTIIQAICFVLLPGLFISTYTSVKNVFSGIIHHTTSFKGLLPDILLVVAIVPITMILGRFFCGWMCSFGSLQDLLFNITKTLRGRSLTLPEKVDFLLKGIKYIVLGISVIFIWTLQIVTVPKGYNPWDVFGMVVSFDGMLNLKLVITDFLPGAILLLALVSASLFIERFFCRYICPLGAVFAIVSRIRIFNINKEKSKCGACRVCTKECSMGISLYKKDVIHSGECINCFKCVDACPRENVNSKLTKLEVTPEAAGTVAAATMIGFFYLGNLASSTLEVSSSTQGVHEVVTSSKSSNAKGTYKDGTYEGAGTGFRGSTTVEVKVSGGKITDVQLISSEDDDRFLDRATDTVISEIVSNQSVDVDAVSGATYSSNGIMEAVANALNLPYESKPIQERPGHRHRE
ncbi:4Fe-4S binding protein [Clostridium cylindrosporum]|uniref:FMN-binding domain protein n=1 Tax=Clostridium cylindrosporum DSM 605 TaxID=1121307 RepID=A0A0J8DCB7_CLOCY|nr:4Fe-4S binding protein [Clostridium cylindrosporum]KMT21949.1 FMN-binding domain protein [Clostridium cylindrosporum DSM 605]